MGVLTYFSLSKCHKSLIEETKNHAKNKEPLLFLNFSYSTSAALRYTQFHNWHVCVYNVIVTEHHVTAASEGWTMVLGVAAPG